MRYLILFSLAAAFPAAAQTLNSTSGSTSGANSQSGSTSGAASNQQQSLDGNIGTSRSDSNSGAVSTSTTSSAAGANSNQTQGQNLTSTNTSGAANTNGQSVSNTFNSTQLKRTYVGTNAAVPLTASSSFSSDFCGSTSSGGVSAAPIGISAGFSATKYDQTCRSLRVAEKAGMLAVSASNMGFKDLSARLTALATWSVCTANGPGTESACKTLALLGIDQATPVPTREEQIEASTKAAADAAQIPVSPSSAAAPTAAAAAAATATTVPPRYQH